jgi:hypothetical protein
MNVEAVVSCEAPVNFYLATWHHIPDDICLEAFAATEFNKIFSETWLIQNT